MIRTDKVQTALFGGVGFRQPSDGEYAGLNAANIGSTSGLYFDDASGFVSIQNIKDCQGNPNMDVDDLNDFITNLQKSVIADVCNRIIEGKSTMVQAVNCYPFEKKFSSLLTVGDRFVGFEIHTSNIINLLAKIDFVELSFNENVTFNLYLYNSNLKTPIKTKSCVCTGGQSTVVSLTDWYISDDTTYKGGKFYIGYFETDLGTAKPYAKDWESSNVKISTQYFCVNPLSMTKIGTTFFDVSTKEYASDMFGLNIGINIYTDYTELIIRNKEIIFPLVQFQMIARVLNLVKTSIRSNITKRLNEGNIDEINLELYGNQNLGIKGINGTLEAKIANVKKMLFYKPSAVMGTLS